MTKAEARAMVIDYLRKYNIHHHQLNDSGSRLIDINDLAIYISFHVDRAPDNLVECSVWFYEDGLEVRGYYSKNAASWVEKNKNHIPAVLHVINFINARVFLGDLLFTPRLHLTADDQTEFAITTTIAYRFFETAKVETLEYMTCYYPEFLKKVSVPLFFTLLGEFTPEEAIEHIKREIIGEYGTS